MLDPEQSSKLVWVNAPCLQHYNWFFLPPPSAVTSTHTHTHTHAYTPLSLSLGPSSLTPFYWMAQGSRFRRRGHKQIDSCTQTWTSSSTSRATPQRRDRKRPTSHHHLVQEERHRGALSARAVAHTFYTRRSRREVGQYYGSVRSSACCSRVDGLRPCFLSFVGPVNGMSFLGE